jgi:hypothetical protein
MSRRSDKGKKRLIFDSIRKPVAPHSKPIGEDRPEERVHPSKRKAKYKKKPETQDSDGDI